MKARCVVPLVVATAVLLISCVTIGPTREALRSRWIGRPAEAFFLNYGLPVNSITTSAGGSIYQWRSDVNNFYVASRSGTVGMNIQVYCELNISTDPSNMITDILLVKDTAGLWVNSRFYEVFSGVR